jgi:hypothetical protein
MTFDCYQECFPSRWYCALSLYNMCDRNTTAWQAGYQGKSVFLPETLAIWLVFNFLLSLWQWLFGFSILIFSDWYSLGCLQLSSILEGACFRYAKHSDIWYFQSFEWASVAFVTTHVVPLFFRWVMVGDRQFTSFSICGLQEGYFSIIFFCSSHGTIFFWLMCAMER